MNTLRTAALVVTSLALPFGAWARAPSGLSGDIGYPEARRDSTVDHYFGTDVPAPYQWMENLDDPALARWVEAENKLTFTYLAKIPVRKWIQQRLKTLWNYPRTSTPTQVAGGRIFFSRNTGLQNQSVLYVQDSPGAEPRELLDPNALSPDGSIALLGAWPSPDGKYLAYSLSQGGSDWQTIHVRDVATGKDLPDAIQWVKFSGASWTTDDGGFFYARYPAPPAGHAISQQVVHQKLYYHRLGTPQSADVLIYARPDLPRWVIGADVSEDGRYLFVSLVNGTAPENELFYADLGRGHRPNVTARLKPLYTKNDAQYDPVGVVGGTLYLRTTLDAPKGRIVAARLANADPAHWREVVPEGDGVIQGASLADGRILVDDLTVAKSRLRLFATDGKALGRIGLPTLGTVGGISARNDSHVVYYGFMSFLYPTSVYAYDVKSGKSATFFEPKVDFDPSRYETRQVFYTSKDGTKVPMFIVVEEGREAGRDQSHHTLRVRRLRHHGHAELQPGAARVVRAGRRVRGGEPARRRHLRRGVASRRHARPQAERLRRFRLGRPLSH